MSNVKTRHLFLAVLLCLLVLFYLPSFSNAPRSDYWVALYYFQLADASPSPLSWLSLCNYDPWEHGTYRPVSHLLLYLEHKLFGVHFIGNHLVNFFMYFLSIVLLFFLARAFFLDTFLTAAFLTVYAFLFSHFDIITWTFQVFTTMSFSAFLLGFLLFIRYQQSGKKGLLFVIGALFLFGMFCFELYALWPLAVILIWRGRRFLFPSPPAPGEKNLFRPTCFMLGIVYALYLAAFILTRMAEQTTGDLPKLTPALVVLGVCSVFFNLLYNGFLVNLFPFVTEPLVIRDNLDMAGLLVGWYTSLPAIICWTGGITVLLLCVGAIVLYRRGKKQTLLILSFFMFLLFTYYFIVSLSRLTTNDVWYPFTQFRYQYVANALLVLMAVTVLTGVIRPKRLGKIVTGCLLLPVLAINMQLSHKYMTRINTELEPLGLLLSTIRSGIERGEITPRAKLFIEDGITTHLPPLCWNEDMALFMKGSYQWFFPADRQNCFTFSPPEASWILRENDYRTIYGIHSGKHLRLTE
ncbi:MAG: hypothetical protein V1789_02450 [PVC group bacterium]